MSAGRRIFYSATGQAPTGRQSRASSGGKIPVVLGFFKQTRFWFDDPYDYERDSNLSAEEFLDSRERLSEIVADKLFPEEEVPAIIDKFVHELSVVSDVPIPMLIIVLVFDVTVSLLGSADYDDVIDCLARESLEYLDHLFTTGYEILQETIAFEANLTPATRSFIQGLNKFRLDSLEEAVIRQNPSCAICLEDFAESAEQLFTCLPCKHHYHVNCIAMWLESNHMCPLCRHPMPTEEAGEPIEAS